MGHMQTGCLDNFILYIIYCGFVGFKKKKWKDNTELLLVKLSLY